MLNSGIVWQDRTELSPHHLLIQEPDTAVIGLGTLYLPYPRKGSADRLLALRKLVRWEMSISESLAIITVCIRFASNRDAIFSVAPGLASSRANCLGRVT
ncbi:hypothetical protein AcW2_005745 [Taiwanofungus camphoratus]|nr:hypothetical protein AcW2_005745 [Antrodia cinnamomea]